MNHYIFTLCFIKSYVKVTVSQTFSPSFLTSSPFHPIKYFLLPCIFSLCPYILVIFEILIFIQFSVLHVELSTAREKQYLIFVELFRWSTGFCSVARSCYNLYYFITILYKILQTTSALFENNSHLQCCWLNKSVLFLQNSLGNSIMSYCSYFNMYG